MIPLDKDTEDGIADAYKISCQGFSTDYLLCNPELNANFIASCKDSSLPGDATVWNRLLLRIRKAGKLPQSNGNRKRITAAAMDPYSAASEAAMQLMSLDYGLSLDDILCSPPAAAEFDRLADQFAPGYTPLEYRWAAMALRKRAKKSRAFARAHFQDWRKKRLPRGTTLDRCLSEKYKRRGVYVVVNHGEPLYVGETLNVKARVEQILHTESWMSFEPTTIKVLDSENQRTHYGLQSILIERANPVLNAAMLRSDAEAVD